MAKPFLVAGDVGVVTGEIEQAPLPEAGLRAGPLVHAAPLAQGLDGERNLAGIAPLLAAPAPVAARLLAGDLAFLAEGHRDALLRQGQRGTGADDAAPDDDHVGPCGDRGIGGDGLYAWGHDPMLRRE